MAELGYYTSKAHEVITELYHHKWIDRRSRGVFVELTVYNAQVNLFSVITLLAEVMPTGGVVTFRRIDTTGLQVLRGAWQCGISSGAYHLFGSSIFTLQGHQAIVSRKSGVFQEILEPC